MRIAPAALALLVVLPACGSAAPGNVTDVEPSVPAAASVAATPAVPAAPTATPDEAGIVARCPATFGTAAQMPAGARRFGDDVASLPLTGGALSGIPIEIADPAKGLLDEYESDDTGDDLPPSIVIHSMTPEMEAVSLVCRYGLLDASRQQQGAMTTPAMLLIPLKPQRATCRFTEAKGTAPASMICRPGEPPK